MSQVHFASASFAGAGGLQAEPGLIPYRTAQLLTLGISQRSTNPYPEALEQRRAETVRRLIDAIVWLVPDEDIGPYIGDQGFRLPDEE